MEEVSHDRDLQMAVCLSLSQCRMVAGADCGSQEGMKGPRHEWEPVCSGVQATVLVESAAFMCYAISIKG